MENILSLKKEREMKGKMKQEEEDKDYVPTDEDEEDFDKSKKEIVAGKVDKAGNTLNEKVCGKMTKRGTKCSIIGFCKFHGR